MAMISCPECGKQISDRAASCPECGCPINAAPVVTVEKNAKEEKEKYLLLARRAKDSDNSADAAKYYGLAQTEDPNSWECAFYSVYFTAMQTNIAGITSAALLVNNCLETVVGLIRDYTPEEQQLAAVKDLVSRCNNIAEIMLSTAHTFHCDIDVSIRGRYENEYRQRVTAACAICSTLGLQLEKAFGKKSEFHSAIAEAGKKAVRVKEDIRYLFPKGSEDSDLKFVSKYDPDFVRSRVEKRVRSIDEQIATLSETHTRNGCAGTIMIILGLGMFILGLTLEYTGWLCCIPGVFLLILGIYWCVPRSLSEERLAENNTKIAALKKSKAELESLYK